MALIRQEAATEVLFAPQKAQALELQTQLTQAQHAGDAAAAEAAMAAMNTFMEGCLNEEQKAEAAATVAQIEADLDAHITKHYIDGTSAADADSDSKAIPAAPVDASQPKQAYVVPRLVKHTPAEVTRFFLKKKLFFFFFEAHPGGGDARAGATDRVPSPTKHLAASSE